MPGTEQVHVYGSWRANAKIADADIITVEDRWKQTVELFLPETITAEWYANDAGFAFHQVWVKGPILKKDRTPGVRKRDRAWGPEDLNNAPKWIQDWVDTINIPEVHLRPQD